MKARYPAAVVAALALTGCGPARHKDPPGVVTLSFYNYASPEFLALYNNELIPAFERRHPNIRIQMTTSMGDAGYDAKLLTLIAGGMPPDIFHVTQQNFPFYAARDVVMPLDQVAKSDSAFHLNGYFPQVVDGLRWKTRLLGLPSDFSTIVVLYNKDLFDKYHVPYPKPDWTVDDFLKTCHALTHDTDHDGHNDVYGFAGAAFYNRWPAWVWMAGGDILNKDQTRCVMDTPKAIEGMQFYADLSLKENVAPTPAQSMGQDFEDLFTSQTAAMTTDSRYSYKRFLRGRGLKFHWDVAPMPRWRTQATTFIWGANCILKSTKHPKEAWEFLKFLSGPEGAAINLKAGNALPPYRKAAEGEILHPFNANTPAHDRYFLDAVAYGRTAPFPPQIAEYDAAATDLQDCFLGIKPTDRACREFTAQVDELLNGKVF